MESEITLERAIELIKRNTRRFAKRQLTWFRADKRINWLDIYHGDSQKDLKKDLDEAADKIIRREVINER